MFTPALLNFIRTQRKAGISEDDLYQQLLMAGWQKSTIEDAMKGVGETSQFVRGVAPAVESTAAVQAQVGNGADAAHTLESTGIFQGNAQPVDQKSILIGQTTDSIDAPVQTAAVRPTYSPPETIELTPPIQSLESQDVAASSNTLISQDMNQTKKSSLKGLKIFLGLFVVVSLVFGGLAVSAAKGILPMQWVLNTALARTATLEQAKFSVLLQMQRKHSSATLSEQATFPPEIDARVRFDGSYDMASPELPLTEIFVEYSDAREPIDQAMTLQIRTIGDIIYMFVQDGWLEGTTSSNAYQWIEIRPSDFTDYAPLPAQADSSVKPLEQEQLEKLWVEHSFFRIDSWLGIDQAYGPRVQKFSLSLDKPALKDFTLAMLSQTLELTDQERRSYSFLLEEALANAEIRNGFIWIDATSGRIRQVELELNLLEEQSSSPVAQMQLQIQLEKSDHRLELMPPEKAIKLEEYFMQQFEAASQRATTDY